MPTLFDSRAHHARVHLDGYDALGHLQQLHRQVACTRPNLQDDIGALDAGFVNDGLHHQRVLQDMLPFALVKLDACAYAASWASTLGRWSLRR